MRLEFDTDPSGNQILSGHVFENTRFHDLDVKPGVGKKTRLEHCKFLNCSTSPGTCVIAGDVALNDVVISNLDCGDAIRISSETEFNEVVIAGDSPKSLIVQPRNESGFMMRPLAGETFQLDISNFHGEVVIVGMHTKAIRKDTSRHVGVLAKWKNDVDWNALRIDPFSYWRIYIKKLMLFSADEGVFSLPSKKDKNYGQTMREMELLENLGLQFE